MEDSLGRHHCRLFLKDDYPNQVTLLLPEILAQIIAYDSLFFHPDRLDSSVITMTRYPIFSIPKLLITC